MLIRETGSRVFWLLGDEDTFKDVTRYASGWDDQIWGFLFSVQFPSQFERFDEANTALNQLIKQWPELTEGDLNESQFWRDINRLEVDVLLKRKDRLEWFLDRYTGSGIHFNGIHFATCVDRHLGAGAALLERYDEAKKHYHEAIRVCTEMPFRPELALSRFQLAELQLEHFPEERTEALEHLEFAISEFEEMKMKPSLEKAIALKSKVGKYD